MSEQARGSEEHLEIEVIVGRMLMMGTVAASILIGVGVASLVLGVAPDLARQLTTAGLITLVATPVLRVLSAIWVYVRERDYVFAAISTLVLAVLACGVLLGKTH